MTAPRWSCEIPRAEGKWIAGQDGPLASLPGSASWAAGVLVLDCAAFRLLEHRGSTGEDDGAVRWDGSGVPVLHAGGGAYEVVPCQDGELAPVGDTDVYQATGG